MESVVRSTDTDRPRRRLSLTEARAVANAAPGSVEVDVAKIVQAAQGVGERGLDVAAFGSSI